ncbi:DUF222 domain-containing protein, partial [Aquipuribacter sp. MA13-6]|uniref:DUF222 domain-containing protein n=1 Tax=Aquipuribacter sp. MA13-6 TaxID=3440839 RepID=UPI003EEE4BF2
MSPVIARDRLELAVELVERRPVTFQALQAGHVDLIRARRICDAVRHLPASQDGDDNAEPDGLEGPEPSDPDPSEPSEQFGGTDGTDGTDGTRARGGLAALVEAEVLHPGSVPALSDRRPARPAGQLTPAQLTARLTRLVLRVDPAGATDRTTLADTRRGCSLRNLPDGMALLSITGRADLLHAAFTRLDTTARDLLHADTRTGTPAGTHGQDPAGTRGLDPAATAQTHASASGPDAARTL